MRYLVFMVVVFTSVSVSAQVTDGSGMTEEVGIVTIDPPNIARPNRYAMGKLAPKGAEVLITGGQVGSNKDGIYAKGIEAQADLAFKNLYEVVRAAGMDSANVMKINLFYLEREHIGVIMAARNRYFGADFRPAQTALVVKSLAGPQILVEVEAIAAKID
tara:strand:+ start:71424 stop:71903 length:480 start_codon:yes stop_codon:yes gene_type:complete